MKKYIKPLKIVSFLAVVLTCAYYTNTFFTYCKQEVQLYKRMLVAEIITEDLSKKEWKLNPQDKPIKMAQNLAPDELRKALWITVTQKDQLQLTIDNMKQPFDVARDALEEIKRNVQFSQDRGIE